MLRGLKQRYFPKGFRKKWEEWRNRLFRRVSGARLRRDFMALGLGKGDLVCVHSAMSGLGFIPGGALTVIKALRDVVGSEGTIMMPTFTCGSSTFRYVSENPPPFDPAVSPSTTGQITEIFRLLPGSLRSLHPTHSVAAQGPQAAAIVGDHHHSVTPFGPGTPFARLVELGGKVLFLNNNGNSLLHHVEEMAPWPNIYRDRRFFLKVVANGVEAEMETAVHMSGPSHDVVLPGKNPDEVRLLMMTEYALPFMLRKSTEMDYERLRPDVASQLQERYRWFQETGIVSVGRVGYGVAALMKAAEFSERIVADLREQLRENNSIYDMNLLAAMKETNRLERPAT